MLPINLGHNEGEANRIDRRLVHGADWSPTHHLYQLPPFERCVSHQASPVKQRHPEDQASMAEASKSNNGQPGAAAQQPPVQAQILGQFIRDLSFENPSAGKPIDAPQEAPNLKVEVNVQAGRVGVDVYESGIDFKAIATHKDTTIYDLELVYMGLFRIKNIPEPALEPFLLINCPTLIFPFLRRLVADITREGGFPPLLLDPIDFASLFMRRQQEQAASRLTN
jgi:preprotein translocase subunit SecB